MRTHLRLLSALIALAASGSVAAAPADSELGYYRDAALHNNELVFTSEGDLWFSRLDEPHPVAHRLTSRPAQEHDAVISADGQQVAFVANYEGAPEAYVMPITGGLPKRVTFEQSQVHLQGWTQDGQLLYATDNSFGPTGTWVLRTVDPQTLTHTDIPLANAVQGSIDQQHNALFFARFGMQVSGDNARAYRGGAAGQIWRYQLGKDQEAQLLTGADTGSNSDPLYYQQRVYFVSDRDGNPNLWSMAADGTDAKQLTHYQDWPVRDPSLSAGHIVFQLGADLVRYTIATGDTETLPLRLLTDERARQPRWIKNPMDYLTNASLTPAGKRVVLTARGKAAIATTDGSRLVTIAQPPHSRIRKALLSKDKKWVYAICDASGNAQIWRFAADGSPQMKQLTHQGQTMRFTLSQSPDGRHLITDDNEGNLWLVNSATGAMRKLLDDGAGGGPFGTIHWSPDSQYLAVSYGPHGQLRTQVALYDLSQHRHQWLTSDKYESFSPAFSRDGHWLYFLSNRTFDATPSGPWGDRNTGPFFDQRTDIYALALSSDASFPFARPSELNPPAPAKKKTPSAAAKPATTDVDWQGLPQRLWQVPVSAANYQQLAVIDDRLYVQQQPLHGKPQLKTIKITGENPKVATFANHISDYQLSQDGQQLLLNQGDNWLIVPAKDKLPKDTQHQQVATKSWRMALQPGAEWQQIFHDAWLMHRHTFYDPTMRGVDWDAVKQQFGPVVQRVNDRHELADLLGQMTSLLSALHSQVRGGDMPHNADAAHAAALGARLTQTQQGVVLKHIYSSDPELPAQASPLNKPGVDAQQGDLIAAINGQPVQSIADVSRLLRNQAGQQVLLTLSRAGQRHKTIVYPVGIRQAAQLRDRDWVNYNRQQVAQASNGRIGYLHLYAMVKGDMNNFVREFFANIDKDGLIIDVRNNRGGNIDSWVLTQLMRKVWMFWKGPHGMAESNMQQAFRGHLAVLTNQQTYSDGETFSAGIKALGIAPLIGMRTSGAGVWLSDVNRLVDGGMARAAQFPQYQTNGQWLIEEHGVTPDIKVDNLPHAMFTGHDAQLQTAIKYLQQQLQQHPIKPLTPAVDISKQPTATKVTPPQH